MSGPRRAIYVGLGLAFVGLGVLGTVLPVLPTTPFLLLASALFIRSSPRLNNWLLRSRLFGPFLRDWQKHHGVRLRVKVWAIAMVVAAVGASIVFGELSWLWVVVLLALALTGIVVILHVRTIRRADLDAPFSDPIVAKAETPTGGAP